MASARESHLSTFALVRGGIATLGNGRASSVVFLPFTAALSGIEIFQHFWPDIDLFAANLWALGANIFVAGYWQRIVLLGLERSTVRGPYAPRYTAYLASALLAGLVILGPAFLIGLLVLSSDGDPNSQMTAFFIVVMAAAAVLLVVVSKSLLVFPALAIGRRLSIAAAWRLGRGQGYRLGFALVLIALLPLAGVILLSVAADSAHLLEDDPAIVAAIIVARAIEVVTTMAAAGCIAVLYRNLTDGGPAIRDAEPA
jgi:hypothetical protein